MAEPDSNAKHGIKLVVKDYPYAVDGLEVWDAMKAWNTDYIDIFYNDDREIQKDTELQAWYKEYRTIGHGDKKQDVVATPGGSWPELNSKTNLAFVLTTMQWIATAMHAPINYGLYDYAGFMPYRPAITRRLIPDHGTQEWEEFQGDPEKFFLSVISDTDTTTTAMSVFEQVSAHAPNEEYIDERSPFWTDDEKVHTLTLGSVSSLNGCQRTVGSRVFQNPQRTRNFHEKNRQFFGQLFDYYYLLFSIFENCGFIPKPGP
jgi:hypothetical protein